jgi:hypothetical protein
MAFSVEEKWRAQQVVHRATPMIPVEIYWLHDVPPVDERLISSGRSNQPWISFSVN